MGLIWSQSLSTGIQWQDTQHQELFNRVNKLFDDVGSGKGKDEILNVIEFLNAYVQKHFGAEEDAMHRHKYRNFDKHLDEHIRFKKDIAGLRSEISKGVTLSNVIKAQNLLTAWLYNHIGRDDKNLGAFLKDKPQ